MLDQGQVQLALHPVEFSDKVMLLVGHDALYLVDRHTSERSGETRASVSAPPLGVRNVFSILIN